MQLQIEKGTTSKIIHVPLLDTASITGGFKTGLLFSGIAVSYMRAGAVAEVATTEVTCTVGTWGLSAGECGIKEESGGLYEFQLPDAMLASGCDMVTLKIVPVGGAEFAPVMIIIELTEKTGYKLAADGWDSLSITEPSGDPDGWTVPQKLMWLIMRFLNKHTSDNFDGIKVHKADDTLATTQAVTEAAGVKTVGKAT